MTGIGFDADIRRWRATGWVVGGVGLGALGGVALAAWLESVPALCVLLLVAGICGVSLASMASTIARPPRLTVDEGGLTMAAAQHETRLLWGQIEQVRIIDRQLPPGFKGRPVTGRGWLVVWLVPGVPVPTPHTYLPVWQPTLAGVRFCDLALLAAPEAEVAAAVRQHAGERFDPARAPR
ncbi:hypothetical protein [Longispora urticae]